MGCDIRFHAAIFTITEFQSTHPSGVRLGSGCPVAPAWARFQSTHPSGVRRFRPRCRAPPCDFNPRTPVGCDALLRILSKNFGLFQSTHPSGVRPHAPPTPPKPARFQSTHPSGVRPCEMTFRLLALSISIHAPQWGATTLAPQQLYRSRISIHAPQWGATSAVRRSTSFDRYFNPRTPVGCDFNAAASPQRNPQFQSTHPSGVRLHLAAGRLVAGVISIHAPQWGATFEQCRVGAVLRISIHAPQWGATLDALALDRFTTISIHAPQWGATAFDDPYEARHIISIHAPQWGATKNAG